MRVPLRVVYRALRVVRMGHIGRVVAADGEGRGGGHGGRGSGLLPGSFVRGAVQVAKGGAGSWRLPLTMQRQTPFGS